MKSTLLFLSLAGLTLAACNNKSASDTPVSTIDTTSHTGDTSSANSMKAQMTDTTRQRGEDSTFLAKASQTGAFEIAAGKLAKTNSQSADVKGFANMMITEHEAMGKDVSGQAQKEGITLPAGMGDDNKKEYDKLAQLKGSKFDKEYVDANVKGHKDAISLFDKTSTDNDNSADVKQLAATGLPKLKIHKEHADALQAKLK